jgi:hypothetical protein
MLSVRFKFATSIKKTRLAFAVTGIHLGSCSAAIANEDAVSAITATNVLSLM